MKSLYRILPLFFALALFAACKSSTQIIENEVGIIRGSVILDENCEPLPIRAGATVTIEGTQFSTTSDSAGNWILSNVPAGIYNILITKPGFDTDLIAQDQFSGAGTQFQEGQQVHLETLLPDSVLISSIQISKKDSTSWRYNDTASDTLNRLIRDTVGYEYPLSITFTMQGQDSAIYFTLKFTDLARNAELYDLYELYNGAAITRNNSITLSATIFSDLDGNGGFVSGFPQPGDTIVVSTVPSPSCQGRKVIVLSKSFVLP